MEYRCPVCGDKFENELKGMIEHTEEHIVEIIKEKHPHWVAEDGICHKCIEYYRNQMKGNA